MTEFTAFSAFARELARLMLTSSELPALRTALLLRLPVRGAAVVAAQRIGTGLAASLLVRALLCRLGNPFLLSLRGGLAVFSLLRSGPLRRLRFGVIATVVIALRNLLQLFGRSLTLHIFTSWKRRLGERFARGFLHLTKGSLTLAITINRFLLR